MKGLGICGTMGWRYLVNTPRAMLAIQRRTRSISTLPGGSIVEASEPVDRLQGLIEVTFNGETVLMFAEDVRKWGMLVEETSMAPANPPGQRPGNQANTHDLSPLDLRRQLEERCRSKLEEASGRYKAATADYASILGKHTAGVLAEADGALARARRAQSEARAEYVRALRIFTGLTIRGIVPVEQPAAPARDRAGAVKWGGQP